jgi:hypothetical protein
VTRVWHDQGRINRDQVERCVALVGSARVVLEVAADGAAVSASGDALEVGFVLGRLAAALAAEGLHCTQPAPTDAGAKIHVVP